jgi:hypothetical protein
MNRTVRPSGEGNEGDQKSFDKFTEDSGHNERSDRFLKDNRL